MIIGKDILSNFFLGGILSSGITLVVQQYRNKVLFLSGFLYTAPLMFPFLLYIVGKYENDHVTQRFVRHCLFGLIFSAIFIIFNYYAIHRFSKYKIRLFLINVMIIIFSFSMYSTLLSSF